MTTTEPTAASSVSEEFIYSSSTTELASISDDKNETNNGTSEIRNLTHNIIAPAETSTLQLDKATRDRIFFILNKRLLNSLRAPQKRRNETSTKLEDLNPSFETGLDKSIPKRTTTASTESNIILFRPTTTTYDQTELTDRSVNDRSKPKKSSKKKTNARGQISPLGNILAQFFVQAIGHNNRNNPYDISTGVSTKGDVPESNLQDFVKLWQQGANNASQKNIAGSTSVPARSNSTVTGSSIIIDVRSKDKDSTLSNFNGLKLEETLNRKIKQESNDFAK